MIEWFKNELSAVKSALFMVTTPLSETEKQEIKIFAEQCPAYFHFISEIGISKLFREKGYYQLGIHLPKLRIEPVYGEIFIIGYSDDTLLGINNGNYVLIDDEENISLLKGSFEDWFMGEFNDIKSTYSDKEWIESTQRTIGFNNRELEIVKSRRGIKWEYLGEKEHNVARFRIENHSDMVLPYFTIGLKRTDIDLFSAVWVKINTLGIGESKEFDQQIHAGTFPLEKTVFYDLPDPMPEEKGEFWEFKITNS